MPKKLTPEEVAIVDKVIGKSSASPKTWFTASEFFDWLEVIPSEKEAAKTKAALIKKDLVMRWVGSKWGIVHKKSATVVAKTSIKLKVLAGEELHFHIPEWKPVVEEVLLEALGADLSALELLEPVSDKPTMFVKPKAKEGVSMLGNASEIVEAGLKAGADGPVTAQELINAATIAEDTLVGGNHTSTKVTYNDIPGTGILINVKELPPVALKDAEHLGQRVHGTSPNSIYWVVALGAHLKLAVRRKNKLALDLRVEGAGLSTISERFEQSNLLTVKNGYASGHVVAANELQAEFVYYAALTACWLTGDSLNPSTRLRFDQIPIGD